MANVPMPTPTVEPVPSLTSFKLLSFDIYGTLIDWETSIVKLLTPLLTQLPSDSPYHDRVKLAAKFNDHEHALQSAHPSMRYDKLLSEAYLLLAQDFGVAITTESVKSDAEAFGKSIADLQPFADTVDAMQRLAKHYKLVPLSNVDKASFAATCSGPLKDVPFWRAYVAEEIGSYKPSLRNFEYLINQSGKDSEGEVKKGDICMVAQSLFHDHVPSKKVGISSCWVNRKGAGMGGEVQALHQGKEGGVGYAWRVGTLGEFADLVDEAFEKEGKV